jgi:hypothetical protein
MALGWLFSQPKTLFITIKKKKISQYTKSATQEVANFSHVHQVREPATKASAH